MLCHSSRHGLSRRAAGLSFTRRIRPAIVLSTVTALLVAAPAEAKQKPITGKLSKPGMTVIALASSGKATSVVATRGAFKLVPPANKVTLQLRAKDGTYAGPVVVGGKGATALLGLKAGAKLGLIRVKNGYAKPARLPSSRIINKSVRSQAKRGVPIGAGVFGRVTSSKKSAAGSGRDADLDGIPGAFDVDDNGNLVLDNFERTTGAAGLKGLDVLPPPVQPPPGQPAPGPAPGQPGPGRPGPGGDAAEGFRLFSNLKLSMQQSLNANAGSVTDAQIDAAMSSTATLAIQVAGGTEAQLDCGGLTYCSAGGTGTTLEGNKAFPGCCDADGNGFGTIVPGSTGDFQLHPGANAADIGSGDSFIEHVTSDGKETQIPGVLNYIFSTTPALKTWTTAAGSGSPAYPIAPNEIGTPGNPIPVAASGDAIATLTFWRPQRKAIEGSGEGSGWVDIGRLRYTADVPNGPSGASPSSTPSNGPGNCAASTYATTDPHLSVAGQSPQDTAEDGPADPANTLTFSVNLTQCLAAAGITWNSGETLGVDIQAVSEFGDNAAQKISFVKQ